MNRIAMYSYRLKEVTKPSIWQQKLIWAVARLTRGMNKRIGFLLLAMFLVLTGCKENNNVYSGIEKNNIEGLANADNIEFINEYKGHTDHWAAMYIVYKYKNDENHTARLFLKYIAKESKPTGELRYEYDTEGGADGHGTLSRTESQAGIYNLGSTGGNGAIADKNSLVKMQVDWNGNSETFELKPEM
ncbi:hypothetical protein [Paenibacillus sabinae]|uniref:Peptidase M56 n=1 Tax=Paenibacillus sabinae T27 TaxID=1268072 RepID=X4ZZR0_9BACL|nr:hypothetical protein [Paenibacillus sabinae]AHV97658.1 peptidase M56 [Paenibacillus sabinae T27]